MPKSIAEPSIESRLEEVRKNLKDPSLHFRPECDDFKCGAHKSWIEGFDACQAELLPLLREAVEMAEFYGDRGYDSVFFIGEETVEHSYGKRAREFLAKVDNFINNKTKDKQDGTRNT